MRFTIENIISVVFKVESEGYQALTELKRQPVSEGLVVSQAALIKKVGSGFTLLDSFDTGAVTSDDTAIGGLVGGLFGIIGGPIGMLLTGSIGALVGSAIDTGDVVRSATLMEKVTEQFIEGEVAIIALAQELDSGAFERRMLKFSTAGIVKEDAAEVAEEVRQAQELQKEMEREAKKKLREEKKAGYKQAVEERREKLKADFESLKEKFTRKD